MSFSKVKRCKDKRVIEAGLDVLIDFRNNGMNVRAFGCCFMQDTLIISFGYGIPYPQNLQMAMAKQVANKLPQEEKYRKIYYYPSDKFDEECGRHCKNLWQVVQG